MHATYQLRIMFEIRKQLDLSGKWQNVEHSRMIRNFILCSNIIILQNQGGWDVHEARTWEFKYANRISVGILEKWEVLGEPNDSILRS